MNLATNGPFFVRHPVFSDYTKTRRHPAAKTGIARKMRVGRNSCAMPEKALNEMLLVKRS